MRPRILLTLLLGGCAGLTLVVFSLRASRLDSSDRGPNHAELAAADLALTDPAVPAPAVPPSAEPREPARPLKARVALGGFLRKVVWEPDRDEPIRDATVRVVLSTSNGNEEELGRCVTDERGAFAFETDLSYRSLPAALRLKPQKEGWTEAWSVPGLPLAIDALPHARNGLVWHMTRTRAIAEPARPPVDPGRAAPEVLDEEVFIDLDPSTRSATWRFRPHGRSRADTRPVRPAEPR